MYIKYSIVNIWEYIDKKYLLTYAFILLIYFKKILKEEPKTFLKTL